MLAWLVAGCGGSLETTGGAAESPGKADAQPSSWSIGVSFVQVASADAFGTPLDYDGDGVQPMAPELNIKLSLGDRSGSRASGTARYGLQATPHKDGLLLEGVPTAALAQPWQLEISGNRGHLLIATCTLTLSAGELQQIAAHQPVIRRRDADCPNPDPSDDRRLELIELSVLESAATSGSAVPADQAASPPVAPSLPATPVPGAAFVAPTNGALVGNRVEVTVAVDQPALVRSLSLSLDGVRVYEWQRGPFSTVIELPDGSHALKLTLTDLDGMQHETDLVSVSASSTVGATPAAQPGTAGPAAGDSPTGQGGATAAGCNLGGVDSGSQRAAGPVALALLLIGLLRTSRGRRS